MATFNVDMMGKKIRKFFDGHGYYEGKVIKVDQTTGYRVRYTDGDQEDLGEEDLALGRTLWESFMEAQGPQASEEPEASNQKSAKAGADNETTNDDTDVRRSSRKRKSTVVMYGKYAVKVNNQYDLEDGEASVWNHELGNDFKHPEIAPSAFYAPAAKKAAKKPAGPRTFSAEELARQDGNKRVQSVQQELELKRDAFLQRHLDTLQPWIPAKTYTSIKKAAACSKALPCAEKLDRQPEAITGTMREYQVEGTSFMAHMVDHGVGCILADEMGLGKTIQSIALIAHLKLDLQQPGATLVVVPLSVLSNWCAEFKKFCPALKVERVHSSDQTYHKQLAKKLTSQASGAAPDVVVTTYDMVKSMKALRTLIRWRLLILDEGHLVKNEESGRAHALRSVRAASKVLLTGTPIQNNLKELWALLSFMNPVFSDPGPFVDAFQLGTHAHSANTQALDQAHSLLRLFCLRRTKREVEVTLPPLIETRVECPLSSLQTFWYRRLLLRDSALLKKVEQEDDTVDAAAQQGGTGWTKLRSLFMQLRKCCNHPYLFPDAEPDFDGTTDEGLVAASGKLAVLDRLLRLLDAGGHRVVLFSQFTSMLDIFEDMLQLRGYQDRYFRLDGAVGRAQRTVDIAEFNRKRGKHCTSFCFLLSTRAGGLGVNLQTADTVILYDSDWNPQVDAQAIARVHRIGQQSPVAALRLVTAGTVEQRVVERAEKKLYLDAMVGRGSTAEAQSLEKRESVDGASKQELLEALSFGADQIFGSAEGRPPTDAELKHLLATARHSNQCGGSEAGPSTAPPPAPCPAPGTAEAKISSSKRTLGSFDASESFTVQSGAEARETMLSQVLEAELRKQEHLGVKGATIQAIARQAKEQALVLASKRHRTSNLVDVVDEWGKTHQVFRNNMYDMAAGEPSVFEQERSAAFRAACVEPTRTLQIPGRDYKRSDACQVCWVSTADEEDQDPSGPYLGRTVVCGGCPATYHSECLKRMGFAGPPSNRAGAQAGQWRCPQHTCATCGVKAQGAGGLLFRCECCPKAMCEDHLPAQVDEDDVDAEGWAAVGYCERFEALGMRRPKEAYWVTCSRSCRQWRAEAPDIFGAEEGEEEEGAVAAPSAPMCGPCDSSLPAQVDAIPAAPSPPHKSPSLDAHSKSPPSKRCSPRSKAASIGDSLDPSPSKRTKSTPEAPSPSHKAVSLNADSKSPPSKRCSPRSKATSIDDPSPSKRTKCTPEALSPSHKAASLTDSKSPPSKPTRCSPRSKANSASPTSIGDPLDPRPSKGSKAAIRSSPRINKTAEDVSMAAVYPKMDSLFRTDRPR